MVVTPWGESDSLRDRMLRRGPGNPPEKVANNQRMRLFGAMVACVAQQGYAATSVADLTRTSGVSRRSFYDLFDDKDACFVATVEAILEAAIGLVLPEDREGDWEERARRDFYAFAAALSAQPAAAKMCLVDAYAAGPKAVELVEGMVAAGEALLQKRFAESPDRAQMPPELVTAFVGGVLEIFRHRFRLGAEVTAVSDELMVLALSYRAPTRPLKRRGQAITPTAQPAQPWDQAARGLLAFEDEVAERGYVGTTVEEVAARAGMSVKTVYSNFSGKEDLLAAAIDSGAAQIVAAVLPAFRRNPYWPEQVRAGLTAFFGFLASRPALAKLMLVEVLAAGQGALQLRQAALAPMESLLAQGRRLNPGVPAIAVEAIMGGILSLAARRVRKQGSQDLPELVQSATYLVLTPFLGDERATTVALGERDSPGGKDAFREADSMIADRGLEAILTSLSQKAATAKTIAVETGETVEEVRVNLEKMIDEGMVQVADEPSEEEPDEPLYVPVPAARLFESEFWSQVPREERDEISRAIHNLIGAEVDRSIDEGFFDARLDRHLVRVPFFLDEQGWSEIDQILDAALDDALAARDRSAERLAKTGETPLEALLAYYLFQLPKP
jgi:AcrR family transcriptional regulator